MLSTEQISQEEFTTQFHHFHLKSVKIIEEIFKSSNFLLHQCKFQIIKDQKNIQKVSDQNQNHQINLQSLFPIKKISFNQPKIDYLNSFVPKIDILFKYKSIIFKVSKTKIPNSDLLIPHQNQINSHLFKPRYHENNGFLQCNVPTQQIMIKTMVGLYQIFELHKIPQPSVTYTKTEDVDIKQLLSHWQLQNSIIFCRIQSLITYLLIEWLHYKNKDSAEIKSLIIELESSRLNKQKLPFKTTLERIFKNYGICKTQFFEYFMIQEQRSQSIFFYGANFTYKGKRISAVMLPWGLQLANELVNTLYILKPNIQKMVIIGGVGFTGQRECNIDDIFIPNSCIFGNMDNFEKVSITNGIKGSFNTEFFTRNNVIEGCIRSVYPQVGKLSQIVGLQKALGRIDAIEMEFEAIYKRAMKGKSDFGAIFYVMDNLFKNIHLGSTYYNREFLQGLFKKYERGKHFCYEKALKYLTV